MSISEKTLHIFSHAVVIFLFAIYVVCTTPNPYLREVAIGFSIASAAISVFSLLGFFIYWLDD